jgi:hypothetical protein
MEGFRNIVSSVTDGDHRAFAVVLRNKGTQEECTYVDNTPAICKFLGEYRVYLSGRYAMVKVDGFPVPLHVLIMGQPPPGHVISHANRDSLDNRSENLRFVPNWVTTVGNGAVARGDDAVPHRVWTSRHYGGWKACIRCPMNKVASKNFSDSKYGGISGSRNAADAWLVTMANSLATRDGGEGREEEGKTPVKWYGVDKMGMIATSFIEAAPPPKRCKKMSIEFLVSGSDEGDEH